MGSEGLKCSRVRGLWLPQKEAGILNPFSLHCHISLDCFGYGESPGL